MATSTLADLPFSSSDVLTDHYQLFTSVRYPLHWFPQRFQVLQVRDLVQNPLSVEQFLNHPNLRRSRYQLRVVNLNTGKRATIYHRLLQTHYRECPLRIGIYEGSQLVDMTTHNWGPTEDDRRSLIRFLAKFDGFDMGEFRVGIFSDDGEVITADSLSVESILMDAKEKVAK